MDSRLILIATLLSSIWGHLPSPQSKDTTPPDILVLTTLTVTECNVKSHDTIKLREPFPQKGLTILLPSPVSLSAPLGHLTKTRRHGAIINLELWQLNHFVWWNYTTMHIDAPRRNPAFVATKWHENGSTLGENGGRWRWNRPLFFRTMRMFQRDAVWLMGWCDGFYAWMIVIHNYASLPFSFFLQKICTDHHNQVLSGVAVQTHTSQNQILNFTKECLNALYL